MTFHKQMLATSGRRRVGNRGTRRFHSPGRAVAAVHYLVKTDSIRDASSPMLASPHPGLGLMARLDKSLSLARISNVAVLCLKRIFADHSYHSAPL